MLSKDWHISGYHHHFISSKSFSQRPFRHRNHLTRFCTDCICDCSLWFQRFILLLQQTHSKAVRKKIESTMWMQKQVRQNCQKKLRKADRLISFQHLETLFAEKPWTTMCQTIYLTKNLLFLAAYVLISSLSSAAHFIQFCIKKCKIDNFMFVSAFFLGLLG